jgi:hypothetical protein
VGSQKGVDSWRNEVRKPLELKDVLSCVEGTSYDIPREEQSLARLERLLERARRIESRYEGICETMGPVVGMCTGANRRCRSPHSSTGRRPSQANAAVHPEQVVSGRRSGLIIAWQHVGIHLECHANICVTETLRYDLDRNTGCQCCRCVAVAEIMKADRAEPCAPDELPEGRLPCGPCRRRLPHSVQQAPLTSRR